MRKHPILAVSLAVVAGVAVVAFAALMAALLLIPKNLSAASGVAGALLTVGVVGTWDRLNRLQGIAVKSHLAHNPLRHNPSRQ